VVQEDRVACRQATAGGNFTGAQVAHDPAVVDRLHLHDSGQQHKIFRVKESAVLCGFSRRLDLSFGEATPGYEIRVRASWGA